MILSLEETDTEYLLQIPPSQKERASSIRPRKWDPIRLRWVYPKEPRIYNALIAEFGDEISINIEKPISQNKTNGLERENSILKFRIKELEKTLDVYKENMNGKCDSEQNPHLQIEYSILQKENIALQQELEDIKLDLQKINDENQYLKSYMQKNTNSQIEKEIVDIAIRSSGNDIKFMYLTEYFHRDFDYAIRIASELKKELMSVLKDDESNLCDLINTAKDAEILSDSDADMAHLIRKQRNIISHNTEYYKTYLARELLTLFAASILWPNLPV